MKNQVLGMLGAVVMLGPLVAGAQTYSPPTPGGLRKPCLAVWTQRG
jgi:hypothetical protein